MKARTDIILANRDNGTQWGIAESPNVHHIPFPGNVLSDFVCLLIFKFNLLCDSLVVIISVCYFLFQCTDSAAAQESERHVVHGSSRAELPCGSHSGLPGQGWGRAGSHPAVCPLPGQKALSSAQEDSNTVSK